MLFNEKIRTIYFESNATTSVVWSHDSLALTATLTQQRNIFWHEPRIHPTLVISTWAPRQRLPERLDWKVRASTNIFPKSTPLWLCWKPVERVSLNVYTGGSYGGEAPERRYLIFNGALRSLTGFGSKFSNLILKKFFALVKAYRLKFLEIMYRHMGAIRILEVIWWGARARKVGATGLQYSGWKQEQAPLVSWQSQRARDKREK